MKKLNVIFATMLLALATFAATATSQQQILSRSFEFRYFDTDPAANGETDFRGPTAVFDTDQRIEFLRKYAEYAGEFFNDPDLDKQVVTDSEIHTLLKNLKPQPLPTIRTTIPLTHWKWTGHKNGLTGQRAKELSTWQCIEGARIDDGTLIFTDENMTIQRRFPPQSWRFFIRFKAKVPAADKRQTFSISQGSTVAAAVGFDENGHVFYRAVGKTFDSGTYRADRWYEFEIEVDLANGAARYNFYLNGELKADYVKLQNTRIEKIDAFAVEGTKGLALDEIWAVTYSPTDNVRRPFTITTFIDENFEAPPSVKGWNLPDYDDSRWQCAGLPKVHGGERYAGRNLYLRKTVHVPDFSRARLNVETLDPGGQIWINGHLVETLENRHPAAIDISESLKPNSTNLIAVKVNHFKITKPMAHTPSDFNIGWFAGRMSLDLTGKTYIDDVFVHATEISEPARLNTRIEVKNTSPERFEGHIIVNVYKWYPVEKSNPAATLKFPIAIGAHDAGSVEKKVSIPKPILWSFRNPNLYKVEVVLQGASNEPVDDYVVTTGLRTISQDGGTFRVNGKPEMLNGAQIMGFRMPPDKIALWNRCAPIEWLAKELLMIKKMNGNMMRVHVHAWEAPARGINDARLAEIGDQLGIMFIWTTTGWIRTGNPWGVDFEGYPKYMRQVYNHPAIVMWEAANHPDTFKAHGIDESNRFCEKVYGAIYPVDSSRLISVSSHIRHMHYGNDAGTIDQQGNRITASACWTAPMVTRGNQDSVTGYGKGWSALRKWPDTYTKDFLDSPSRAYFNFEHEESTGQPNWALVKGKPWYHLQSYEWPYDKGSIGRMLTFEQWRQSQAWQAFSAYESMKKQRILDYDGFSWCCLHGGANNGTYKKPLIDCLGHAKLAFYTNKMAFQRILAASNNVDIVYGPDDQIHPVIINLGDTKSVDLTIAVRNMEARTVDTRTYRDIRLSPGRIVVPLAPFKPDFSSKGHYAIEYETLERTCSGQKTQ